MTRLRPVLSDLATAAIFCGVPVALARLGLRPVLDRVFIGHPALASAVGRASILIALLLGYLAFVHYFERREATELMPRWRSLLLGGLTGSLLIGAAIATLLATGHYRLVAYRGFEPAMGVIGAIRTYPASLDYITDNDNRVASREARAASAEPGL